MSRERSRLKIELPKGLNKIGVVMDIMGTLLNTTMFCGNERIIEFTHLQPFLVEPRTKIFDFCAALNQEDVHKLEVLTEDFEPKVIDWALTRSVQIGNL